MKNIRIARKINSLFKGVFLDVEYKIQCIVYKDNANLSAAKNSAFNTYTKHPIQPVWQKNSDSLNIFFVGTYFDHEMQGFFQGLEGMGDVQVYINMLGGYGLNKPKNMKISEEVNSKWGQHLYESVYQANMKKRLDFVIGTFTAPNIDLATLKAIKALGIPIINYAMDDMLPQHWRVDNGVKMGAFGLAAAVDLNLQTTPRLIPRYLNSGYSAIYFPFASDPDIFFPREQKTIDVLFVGNCYGKREQLIGKCINAGINITSYGEGFPAGHIPGHKVPELFGQSKIILGSGLVGHSSKLITLKLRDFDAPMSGGLYLTTHSDLLSAHFKIGEEIVTYKNADDCIRNIKFYLDNEKERQRIAENGRRRCLAEHTWRHRLEKLPGILGSR